MPSLHASLKRGINCITAKHPTLGKTHLYCLQSPIPVSPANFDIDSEEEGVEPQLLFTENNTNFARLYNGKNETPYVKDAFHDHVIPSHRPDFHKNESISAKFGVDANTGFQPRSSSSTTCGSMDRASHLEAKEQEGPTFVNLDQIGTKSAAHYIFRDVPAEGGCAVVRLKLTPLTVSNDPSISDEGLFDDTVEERRQEADEFYDSLVFGPISDDLKQIMRQALGGMLWTKQHYQFIQQDWIKGDPAQPQPPPGRKYIRNFVIIPNSISSEPPNYNFLCRNGVTCIFRTSFPCLISQLLNYTSDYIPLIIFFRWEYPFFAAWDTAFHCIPLAVVDPAFAKKQLDLLTREWYMKPDGQIPAYEWNFSDVNPPVHAWWKT
jgi:hypothetical protein